MDTSSRYDVTVKGSGPALRRLRAAAKMSVLDVAVSTGVPRDRLVRYEADEERLPLRDALAYARAVRVDPLQFLFELLRHLDEAGAFSPGGSRRG